MFAIMGATGNVGRKLADSLLEKDRKVRVIGRSADRLQEFVERGAEAAVGDASDRNFLAGAFKGAEAVFAMIPPDFATENLRAYQNEIGENIAFAIQQSGVSHVVNLSSHGAHLPDKTGPILGLYDQEQRLNRLDDVNVLHLRPTYFMENLLPAIGLIKEMGVNGSAIKGDIEFAMIATQDIAAAAADHLLQKDFSGKEIHELLGERDVSLNEVTKIIGKKIGKPDLAYVQFPPEDAKKGMMEMGLSESYADAMLELAQALHDGIFAVNQKRTTGNTTSTSVEEFAATFAQVYKNS